VVALAEAAALTDAYRRGQGSIASRTAALSIVALRALLNPSNLDDSFRAYVAAMYPILGGARSEAATLAAAYYDAHRLAAGVTGQAPEIARADALTLAQTAASLLFTGPVTIKQQLANGNSISTALRFAEAATSRAMFRHTANAGRGTIFATAERDRRALGYARVTDGSPCAFCAMLASRGAVYKTDGSGGGRGSAHRYHDGCNCTVQAVYTNDDEIPGDGGAYADLWADSTKGVSGQEKARAFRRAYEAQR
jgi:hypothetical protein